MDFQMPRQHAMNN